LKQLVLIAVLLVPVHAWAGSVTSTTVHPGLTYTLNSNGISVGHSVPGLGSQAISVGFGSGPSSAGASAIGPTNAITHTGAASDDAAIGVAWGVAIAPKGLSSVTVATP
jgi:hypothetical protein